MKAVEDYIRSLGIGAYVVGGAVRDDLLGLEAKDADFLVESQTLSFDVRPVSATAIDAMLAEVYQTPKDVIARATKAISSEGQ